MGEFMQQQGDEEQGCSDQRGDPDLARATIRVCLTEVFAEGERDQGSDNEPAIMKPDLDARDSSEFDVGAHSRPSLRETMQLRITGYSNSSGQNCQSDLRHCCSKPDLRLPRILGKPVLRVR